MTSEENARVDDTAVTDLPPPAQEEAAAPPPRQERVGDEKVGDDGRGELIKFGLLILVFAVIIGGVALSRSFIFEQLLPGIMRSEPTPAEQTMPVEADVVPPDTPAAEDAPAVPADSEEEDTIFIPALTDSRDESEESSAVEEVEAAAEGEEGGEPAAKEPLTHVVQPGDTMTRIAQQYNVSVEALMAANNLSNANYIQVGQTLVIPTAP